MSEANAHHPHHHETAPLHDAPDAWHDHSHDERPMVEHGNDVDTRSVLAIGVALFFVVVIACVIVYAFYVQRNTQNLSAGELATKGNSPAWDTRASNIENLSRLEKGGSLVLSSEVDGKTVSKTVTIRPITEAMKDVASRYSARPAAQGN